MRSYRLPPSLSYPLYPLCSLSYLLHPILQLAIATYPTTCHRNLIRYPLSILLPIHTLPPLPYPN